MSKNLMKSLKADLPALAEMIRAKGRGRDTILAHITPKEAALLKRRGGRGSINPDTGLPEYEDVDFGSYDYSAPADVSPVYDVVTGGGGQEYTFTPMTDVGGVAQPAGQVYTEPYSYAGAEQYSPEVWQQFDQAAAAYAPSTFQLPAGYDVSTAAFTPAEMAAGSQRAPGAFAEYTPAQISAFRTELGLSPLEGYGEVTPEAPSKEKSYLDKLLSSDTAAKLGLASLLGYGLTKGVAQPAAKQATQQAQQAAQQYQQLAQPYRSTAQNLIKSAQTGALTPSNLQAVNTARQIAAQNIRARGGVGVEQAANQIAQLEANLLEQQFNTGLRIANIADQYDAQAITTALSANQAVVGSNAAFYTQLANMLAPFVFGTGQMVSPQQQVTRASTTGGGF